MQFKLPEPLHGWRAFAGEVGIIVLGVLIALGFGQLVDTWQWRDKISHAEESMRLELADDDGPQAYGRLIIGPCLDAELIRIHDEGGHVSTVELRQWARTYMPPFRSWDSEAWQTLLGSDVGSHMGSQRLIQWSSPYRVINNMTAANATERDLATDLRETLSPDGDPSAAELQTLRRTAAQLQVYNSNMFRASQLLLSRSRALGAPVSEAMQRQLLREAQGIYGSCVHAPDLTALPVAARLRGNLRLQPITNGK